MIHKTAIVGTNVKLGKNVEIGPYCIIGDGAVIGAGAVVAKSVEPYSIVVGNPAREIRKRFDDQTIEKLLKLKWWDMDIGKINEHIKDIGLDIIGSKLI